MPLTPSSMVPLGTLAPDFRLPDTTGQQIALSDFAKPLGRPTPELAFAAQRGGAPLV